MDIAVFGAGYVGFANAIVLAQHNRVIVVDIDPAKVASINNGKSPVHESRVNEFLAETTLQLRATTEIAEAVSCASVVIIATPTDYDLQTGFFNTSTVEQCINQTLQINPQAIIVIRSTIPIGFTSSMQKEYESQSIFFVPEFLREGQTLQDSLYPSRIVIGGAPHQSQKVVDLFLTSSRNQDVPVLLTGPREAEAIKLFSNSYLALRVAYFNEVDTYAISEELNAGEIITGIGLDPRIGAHYNNPSFGYGGYCLPKDTKQLLANYSGIPQDLISAVVESNSTRKSFIASDILSRHPQTVGIFRLIMKVGSDNFRSSSIFGIIERLRPSGVSIIVFEPNIDDETVAGCEVVTDISTFKQRSDLIVTNRRSPELDDVQDKVYTRDLFDRD
ncbi:MAG: nucleotide sugar dehydrogenase [Propionibacteriaceae bacterium]|nr:nucleotide sugar dehydrogenase [Propionibacteriaceae bacterium]